MTSIYYQADSDLKIRAKAGRIRNSSSNCIATLRYRITKKNSVPEAEMSVQLLWSATWEKELPHNIDPADWLRIDINRSASLIQLPAAFMYVGINWGTKLLVASKKKKRVHIWYLLDKNRCRHINIMQFEQQTLRDTGTDTRLPLSVN